MVCAGLRVIHPNDVALYEYQGHVVHEIVVCIGNTVGNEDGPMRQVLCCKSKGCCSITPMCWRYKVTEVVYYDPPRKSPDTPDPVPLEKIKKAAAEA